MTADYSSKLSSISFSSLRLCIYIFCANCTPAAWTSSQSPHLRPPRQSTSPYTTSPSCSGPSAQYKKQVKIKIKMLTLEDKRYSGMLPTSSRRETLRGKKNLFGHVRETSVTGELGRRHQTRVLQESYARPGIWRGNVIFRQEINMRCIHIYFLWWGVVWFYLIFS